MIETTEEKIKLKINSRAYSCGYETIEVTNSEFWDMIDNGYIYQDDEGAIHRCKFTEEEQECYEYENTLPIEQRVNENKSLYENIDGMPWVEYVRKNFDSEFDLKKINDIWNDDDENADSEYKMNRILYKEGNCKSKKFVKGMETYEKVNEVYKEFSKRNSTYIDKYYENQLESGIDILDTMRQVYDIETGYDFRINSYKKNWKSSVDYVFSPSMSDEVESMVGSILSKNNNPSRFDDIDTKEASVLRAYDLVGNKTKGSLGEKIIKSDLEKLGYKVRNIGGSNKSWDLEIETDCKNIRVEVKFSSAFDKNNDLKPVFNHLKLENDPYDIAIFGIADIVTDGNKKTIVRKTKFMPIGELRKYKGELLRKGQGGKNISNDDWISSAKNALELVERSRPIEELNCYINNL